MGLFSFTEELAVDLGTANTIIMKGKEVLLDEPSIVALNNKTNELVAVGSAAAAMHERTNPNVSTIRPLRDGVIADFYAAEMMIRGMIKKTHKKNRFRFFSPSLRMVVCIPSGSTEVEIRAVRDSSEHAGGRDVYMLYEPMAAAIGIGLDVHTARGRMIVDIGGGTTEIAVISLGGLVCNKSIRIAGDELTSDIQDYMRRQHNIKVGAPTAEKIKIHVGSALTELPEDEAPEDYTVVGPNNITSLPLTIPVSYQEISHCIDKSLSKMEAAIMAALEDTPPELYQDIVNDGIYLTGGGALLRGLAQRFQSKMNINFIVPEDPQHAVARGTGKALENIDKYTSVLIK